jgi:hypothetical protein
MLKKLFLSFFFFFFFCNTGVWTQDFTLARQVGALLPELHLQPSSGIWTQGLLLTRQALYHLESHPQQFLLYFLKRVSHLCLNNSPPIYTSCITGMTVVHYSIQFLLVEMGVLPTFCPGWPQTGIFLISTSLVARITGVSHKKVTFKNYTMWFSSTCFFISPYQNHVCLPVAGVYSSGVEYFLRMHEALGSNCNTKYTLKPKTKKPKKSYL